MILIYSYPSTPSRIFLNDSELQSRFWSTHDHLCKQNRQQWRYNSNVQEPVSHSKNLWCVMHFFSHSSKILWYMHMRCRNGGRRSSSRSVFLLNIRTAIICSTLMPWNAAYLRFCNCMGTTSLWLVTPLLTLSSVCPTDCHVNLKAVGFSTNLSRSVIFTIHKFLFWQLLLMSPPNVCFYGTDVFWPTAFYVFVCCIMGSYYYYVYF